MNIHRIGKWAAILIPLLLTACGGGDAQTQTSATDSASSVASSSRSSDRDGERNQETRKEDRKKEKSEKEKEDSEHVSDKDDHDDDDHDNGDNGGSSGSPPPTPGLGGDYRVFAVNDLGMHCMDDDFAVFSILPPFNNLHAQVLKIGGAGQKPQLLDISTTEVRYSAVADAKGSSNSTSIGKTNFWDYAQSLFGISLPEDTGLTGNKMPSTQVGPQAFPDYDTALRRFTVSGIPITPTDDQGQLNNYPLFRVEARDRNNGQVLAHLDAVVPVSTEMDCADCHNTDGSAADAATAARYANRGLVIWSSNTNATRQYKENVLLLHDIKHGTTLYAEQPVLCADCHYSPALDLAGAGPQGQQLNVPFLSYAIHGRHGKTVEGGLPDNNNPAIIADSGTDGCYNCHPGKTTQCLRGAMTNQDIGCLECHGTLLAVAGEFPLSDGRKRQPWLDLPRCESCHTGDALNHQGNSMISKLAYTPGDPAATPLLATNRRFAENTGILYRNSTGHGGVACASCHGSPHAIWPNDDPDANDNVASRQLQGYAGTVTECSVCHSPGSLPLTTNGPHGMHNVNDARWVEDHGDYFERNPNACQTCHGLQLEGTSLARTAAARSYRVEDRQVNLAEGTQVSCTLCHGQPD